MKNSEDGGDGGEVDMVSSSSGDETVAGEGGKVEANGGVSSSSEGGHRSHDDTDEELPKAHIFTMPQIPRPQSHSPNPASISGSGELAHSSSSSNSPPRPEKKHLRDMDREKEEKYQQILSNLKYAPPDLAAPCADTQYNLEVLKNGTIVDNITFSTFHRKGYFLIGRVPGCDIIAENPTVSRIHAVLQFVKGDEGEGDKEHDMDNPKTTGLYIYDLNSTHGTFLNKNQLYPRKWYRAHVGHVLKFGSSQRMYIVNGPEVDTEPESDKSVTELQNERLAKDLERKRIEEEGQLKREVGSKLPKENIEQEGIDWGMQEDADEETDMRINPFALDYETSELNLDNPKKSLRSWFEREGHELEYEIREKAAGQFVCRIGLPELEGAGAGVIYAESEVKTKKKEAAAEAALKACQILDRYGVLRTSNQESRKRKEKKWEDEDYYSSDEDTYLDRTGSIEQKRQKRMRLLKGGDVEGEVLTFESLSEKNATLEREIAELEQKIEKGERLGKKRKEDEDEVDIDEYVNLLKSGAFEVKQLKSSLKGKMEERGRIRRLMEIAKPAELPSYLKGKKEEVREEKSSLEEVTTTKPKETLEAQVRPVGPTALPKPVEVKVVEPPPQPKRYGLITPDNFGVLKQPVKVRQVEVPPKDSLEEEDEDEEDDGEEEEITPEFEKPQKKKRQRIRNRKKGQEEGSSSSSAAQSFQNDPNYSEWVPPSGQSGDGRTSLNEKLGY